MGKIYRLATYDAWAWSQEKDELIPTTVEIFFDSQEPQLFHLNFFGQAGIRVFGFNFTDMPQIKAAFEKYHKWNKQALEGDGVILNKQIDEINALYGYIQGKKESFSQPRVSVRFYFFSQNEKNHQLLWGLPPLLFPGQDRLGVDGEYIYFDHDQVTAFEEIFSFQYWFSQVEKIIKRINTEASF